MRLATKTVEANSKGEILLKSKAAEPGASQAFLWAEGDLGSALEMWPLMPLDCV